MLLHFVADEMGQDDHVVIASTSNRIGFLQQLTDDKDVLRAAVARLTYQQNLFGSSEYPPMTEYEAYSIEQGDEKVNEHFMALYLSRNPGVKRNLNAGIARGVAEKSVAFRARQIMQQSEFATKNTLFVLENLMRSSAELPGRKLLFLLSDGFLANTRNQTARSDLNRVIDAGLRSNVVIYSLQTSGLTTSYPDASSQVFVDDNMETSTSILGEDTTRQDPLYSIAKGTGGRAFPNANLLDNGIGRAFKETGRYYLLGWYPENERNIPEKLNNIEISIRGRPELKMLLQKVFLKQDAAKSATDKTAKAQSSDSKSADEVLSKALGAFYPGAELPVALSVTYLQTPKNGAVATILTQISTANFDLGGDKETSNIDLAGIVFDDNGKPVSSFKDHLIVNSSATESSDLRKYGIVQATQTPLKIGLYQVRVAARHDKTGQTGSASEWILIPDFKTQSISLGSLFLGERTFEDTVHRSNNDPLQQARISVDHCFTKTSHLRFLTYVYNASPGVALTPAADVVIEGRILHDNKIVVTMPVQKIESKGAADPSRIPYAGELSMEKFSVGRYVMVITATDRLTKISSSQSVNFRIE